MNLAFATKTNLHDHPQRRRVAAIALMLGASCCALGTAAHAVAVSRPAAASAAAAQSPADPWTGTWATAPQPPFPGPADRYDRQTLRLVVHTTMGGARVRIRISNTFGSVPLRIAAAHIGRRTTGADVDPASDRALTFEGRPAAVVPAGQVVFSDPADLEVPALSDLAVSFYFAQAAAATTTHALTLQTSYLAKARGDASAATHFPAAKEVDAWPFLTGVDVAAPSGGSAVVVLGDSTVDGDGSTPNPNARWTDRLAARLQAAGGPAARIGVLNEGLIGNRLLHDSPRQRNNPGGAAFGQSALARFDRDVVRQAGARVVIVRTGGNDLGFPGAIAPAREQATPERMIEGYRALIARARQAGLRVIGTTLMPFEHAAPVPGYYSPAKEAVRQRVNAWIRGGGEFDAVIDVDRLLADPAHPARLLARYDSGDHLHPNDAGYAAVADAIPLEWLTSAAAPGGVVPSASQAGRQERLRVGHDGEYQETADGGKNVLPRM